MLSVCGLDAKGEHVIRLFSAENNELVGHLAGHRSRIFAVSFSQDGSKLASGANHGEIIVWNTQEMSSPEFVRFFVGGPIYALNFSSFENILAVRYGAGVTLWNIAVEPAQIWNFENKPMYLSNIVFIGCEHEFVITTLSEQTGDVQQDESTLVVWRSHDVCGAECHRTIRSDGAVGEVTIYDVAVAQHGNTIATLSLLHVSLWQWCSETLSLNLLRVLSSRAYTNQILFAFAFSDGTLSEKLFCISDDCVIGWDIATYTLESEVNIPSHTVATVSPLQKKIAVVEIGEPKECDHEDCDETVLLCDSSDGSINNCLSSGLYRIHAICFSPATSVVLL